MRLATQTRFLNLIGFAIVGICPITILAQGEARKITGWGKNADPEKDCKFLERDGKLIVKVPDTYHDFHPQRPYKNNGPRVYREAAGNFMVEVKVAGTIVPNKGTELP